MTVSRRSAVPDRRRLLGGAVGLAALGWAGPLAAAVPTPAQGRGPFYPATPPLEDDADLARTAGRSGRAEGRIIHVLGRVLDAGGRPLPGARVEIWQADAFGRYHHPSDTGGGPIDPGFQGFGVSVADQEGWYRFRTVRPGAYATRTPHIHFDVQPPGGAPLVTQMYFAGEPRNADDPLLRSIRDPAARAAVIVAFEPAPPRVEDDALAGRFDIVFGR